MSTTIKFRDYGAIALIALTLVACAFKPSFSAERRVPSSDLPTEREPDGVEPNVSDALKATGTNKRAKSSARLTEEEREKLSQAATVEYNSILEIANLERNGRVKVTDRFLIAYNTSDPYAEWIAALTGEVADGFERFLRKMKLDGEPPKRPMYVFLFAQRSAMDAFEQTLYRLAGKLDEMGNRQNTPSGFYTPTVNRMVIYDQTEREEARVELSGADGDRKNKGKNMTRAQLTREARELKTRDNAVYNTETIVHELTHQLSYNYGLLRRDGSAPSWYVEGLAMLFEPSDGNAPLGWRYKNVLPINSKRYAGFCHYANNARDSSIIDELIASDQPIRELSLDAYDVSWALVYYCYKKRSKEFVKFMKLCRDNPAPVDDPVARKKSFEECFGKTSEFKTAFLKYMKSL